MIYSNFAVSLSFICLLAAVLPLKAEDDTVTFETSATEVIQHDGRWKVAAGDLWLIDCGTDRQSAVRARDVIRHYGINEQRFVGTPNRAFTFYTSSGRAPAGAMPGEDAIAFNPANLAVRQIEGSWKLVDGELWLVDLGTNEAAARDLFDQVHRFGFDHIAYVGRPDAPMTYFRSSSGTPPAPVPSQTQNLAGQLSVTVIEGERGPANRPAVTLVPDGGTTPVTLYENPAEFRVAPGRYSVRARVGTGLETSPRDVELVAGRPMSLTLNTATGTLILSLTAGGQPLTSCPNVALKNSAGPVAASSELPARFQAQEGEYFAEIEFTPTQIHRISSLQVTAGQTTQATAEVPCGTIVCRVTGSPDRHPYVEVRNADGLVAAQSGNPARFQILAGEYQIGVRSGDRMLGSKSITVAPGGNVDIELRP